MVLSHLLQLQYDKSYLRGMKEKAMETGEGILYCAWQVSLVPDVIIIVTLKQ